MEGAGEGWKKGGRAGRRPSIPPFFHPYASSVHPPPLPPSFPFCLSVSHYLSRIHMYMCICISTGALLSSQILPSLPRHALPMPYLEIPYRLLPSFPPPLFPSVPHCSLPSPHFPMCLSSFVLPSPFFLLLPFPFLRPSVRMQVLAHCTGGLSEVEGGMAFSGFEVRAAPRPAALSSLSRSSARPVALPEPIRW